MNQRASTWGDLLDRRSGSRFIGRRREVEAFRLNCLYDVPQSLLFVLEGSPGVGKTALLARYDTIAREHSIVTAALSCRDVRLTEHFAIINVMAALGRRLAEMGVPLTTFQEVLKEYYAALADIDPEQIATASRRDQPPGHVWALFGGVMDDDEWARRAWDTYLVSAASVRWSRLIQDPVTELTNRFVQDLNAWATVRRIVLSLDDYHLMPAAVDAWLRALLGQGELSTNIWFILAIDRPLSAGWEQLSPVMFSVELQPLSRSDSRALLLSNEQDQVTALQRRLDLSRGNPLSLMLISKMPAVTFLDSDLPLDLPSPQGVMSPQDSVRRAVAGYLAHLALRWRGIFLRCSAARWLDADLLLVLFSGTESLDMTVGVDEVDTAGARAEADAVERMLGLLAASPLTDSSLEASPAGKLRWHTAVFELVAQWAQSDSAYVWRNAHQRLFAYYRQRTELRGDGLPRYLDTAWQHDQTEALYHTLVLADLAAAGASSVEAPASLRSDSVAGRVSGDAGRLTAVALVPEVAAALIAVLLSFAEGCLYFRPWAGSVVRLWQDAARICDPVGPVAVWLVEVEALSSALFAGDWERALALLDMLIEAISLLSGGEDVNGWGEPTYWSPNTLQALRNLRQLTAARLAYHPDSPASGGDSFAEGPAFLSDAVALDQSDALPPDPQAGSVVCSLPSTDPDGDAADAAVHAGEDVASRRAFDAQDAGAASEQRDVGIEDAQGGVAETAQTEASAVEHCHYANARLDDADYETAIQAYDQALALNPRYVAAYYNRGLAYARMGALDRAIADFARAIDLDPNQASAYHQRGLALARQGALEQAADDYTKALALRPDAAAILYARANAYFRLHAHERAIVDYTAVLGQDASRSDAFLNRGLALVAMGNYLDALRDYNQAIVLDADRAVAFSRRGQVYVHLERYTEALADYQRAVRLDPRDATVYNSLGLLYVRIEAYAQAVEAYQQAMALQPDWATPYYNAACAAALAIDGEELDDAADRACVWLSRAVALRERYRAMALTDPDFAKLRASPRFRSIVDGVA